jgi:hypothetical protein
MNTKFLFAWITIFVPVCSFCQLPVIEFSTYTPRWFQILEDSSFVLGSNENLNSFNSVYPVFYPTVEDTFTYTLFSANNGNYERDGGVLVKIRNDNGTIVWSKFMNTNNGDDQNYYTNYFVNDFIYTSGRKRTRHSINEAEVWQIGGHSKPFYRVIDKKDGAIQKEIFDTQDSVGIFDGFIKEIILTFNNRLFQMQRMEEGVLISRLIENTVVSDDEQFLPYPEPIPNEFIFKTRSLFIRENDQRCNVFFHSVSNDTLAHPHVGRLDYYQYMNDSFQLHRSIDFSKYIKRVPVSGIRDRFNYKHSKAGNLVISQAYQEAQYPYFRNWLLNISPEGEIIDYVEEVKLENQNHTYETCIPFYVDNHNIYSLAYPPSNGESGIDLIQVLKGGEILLKGHLTTGNTQKLGIGGIDMNEHGDIVFLFQWEGKYSGAMGLHISDFGINLSSADENISTPTPLLTVSPNPASDNVTLDISDEKYQQGTVHIYTLTGEIVFKQKINHGEPFDIGFLHAGSYIIQYSPDNRPGYFLTTKLIRK